MQKSTSKTTRDSQLERSRPNTPTHARKKHLGHQSRHRIPLQPQPVLIHVRQHTSRRKVSICKNQLWRRLDRRRPRRKLATRSLHQDPSKSILSSISSKRSYTICASTSGLKTTPQNRLHCLRKRSSPRHQPEGHQSKHVVPDHRPQLRKRYGSNNSTNFICSHRSKSSYESQHHSSSPKTGLQNILSGHERIRNYFQPT